MVETFYFSHDYNVRTDKKVKKLLARHGYMGYGIFWALVEDLYNNHNSMTADYECLAFDLRVDVKIIKSIINDFDLFVVEGDEFRSNSIEKRLGKINEKIVKAKESAAIGWQKRRKKNGEHMDAPVIPDAPHNESICEPSEQQMGSNAINDIKGNDIKGNKSKDNDEVHVKHAKHLLSENGSLDLEKLKIQLRREITDDDCKEFNAFLFTEKKNHEEFQEWNKHFRNWLVKSPTARKPPTEIKPFKLKTRDDFFNDKEWQYYKKANGL